MKSSTQILREAMDALTDLTESPFRKSQHMFSMYIPNPAPQTPGDEDWESEIEIGVDYKTEGGYTPAGNDAAADYPDISDFQAFDDQGNEISDSLPENTKEMISDACFEHYMHGDVDEAVQPAGQVVDEAAEDNYDFTMEITDESQAGFTKDYEIGVNFEVSGKESPATFDSPAEYPDLDILDVVDLNSGRDITNQLSRKTMQQITDKAWEAAHQRKQDDDFVEPDDGYYDGRY